MVILSNWENFCLKNMVSCVLVDFDDVSSKVWKESVFIFLIYSS